MILAAAGRSAAAQSFLALHLWHLVGAIVFLAVGLGVAVLADRRAPARSQRPSSRTAPTSRAVTAERPVAPWSRLTSRGSEQAGPASRAWLTLCVVAAVGAATVHFVVMPDHFEESLLYGCFFAVLASCQLGWSAAVLRAPSRRLLLAGAAANGAVVVLWLMTRLVAIPLGPAAGTVEPFSGLDTVSSSLELVVMVTAARLLWRPRLPAHLPLPIALRSPLLLGGLVVAAGLVTATALVSPPS